MKSARGWGVVGMLLACAAIGAAQDGSAVKTAAKDVYEKAKTSVVKIETDKKTGTGFFYLGPDLVVTCYHVISDASRIAVKDTAGHSWEVDSVYFDKKADAAILKVKGEAVKPLPSADPGKVSVGDDLYVIGNPLGYLDQTLTTGVLSGRRDRDGIPIFQTSAAVSPGSSGSPVLTSTGAVIGFISFTMAEGQGLNMAVGCAPLVALLKNDPIPVSLFCDPSPAPAKAGDPAKEADAKPSPDEATDAFCKWLNQLGYAYQNWRIRWCRARDQVNAASTDAKFLEHDCAVLIEATQGAELASFVAVMDNRHLWTTELSQRKFAGLLEELRSNTLDLQASRLETLAAMLSTSAPQYRRANSIFVDRADKFTKTLNTVFGIAKDEGWLNGLRLKEKLNWAAWLRGIQFERTYVIPDPFFPDKTQLAYVEGNPFHTTDIILGVKLRKQKTFTPVITWLDLISYLETLPEGRNDLIFHVKREDAELDLGVFYPKVAKAASS